MKQAKNKASDRTVDMFTGQTNVEAAEQSDVSKIEPRLSETIEQSAERWRANAMFTAEHFSKSFNKDLPSQNTYRLTEKGDVVFLEKFEADSNGAAYHWAGLMFPKKDMSEIKSLFIDWSDG